MTRFRLATAIGHVEWLRRGLRERLIRVLVPDKALSGVRVDLLLQGHRVRASLDNWMERNVWFFGSYERAIRSLRDHLSRGQGCGVFVDIGANIGLHMLFASSRLERVHAFEPYPPVRARLAALLRDDGIENVEVHAVGVGSVDAELPFFAPPCSNLGSGSFCPAYSVQNEPCDPLPVVAGDAYFTARIGPVQTLKVDVEGYELEVLRGLRRTLETSRPDLIVELTESTRREVESLSGMLDVLPRAYRIFDIEARKVYAGLFERPCLELVRARELEPGVHRNRLMIPAERVPALRATGLAIE